MIICKTDIMTNLGLTEEQLKAVKSVERALIKANKLGVEFWENYGNLAAYNNNKIQQPSPDNTCFHRIEDHYEIIYEITNVKTTSNTDDELFFNVR